MGPGGPGAVTGLLVDYGGVLTTSVAASFAAWCAEVGLPGEHVRDVIAEAYGRDDGEGPVEQLETGRLSPEAFGHRVARDLTERSGVAVEGTDLLARLFARLELDERMLAAVEAARRAGVRTGLLSNSWGDTGYPRERFGALFDVVVISAEVGLRKPDPAIFRHAVDALGLPAERCCFIDDLPANVEAAEALGMAGIVHRDAATTLPRLAEVLGIDPALLDPRPAG